MNPELYETIRFIAGLLMLGTLGIGGLVMLLIIGMSQDPDAWLDRQAHHWRVAREDRT